MQPISKANNKRCSTRNKLMEYGIIILLTLGIRYLLFDTITIASSNNDKITKTTMKTTKKKTTATGNDNDNDNTDNTDEDDDDDNDNNFEFVVLLGLEGTGHHLYNALIDQSPYFKIYQNLINSTNTNTTSTSSKSDSSQSLLNELRHSLFDGSTKSNTNIGLINAPCTERRVPVLKAKKKAKNNKAKKSNSSSRRIRQQSSSSSSSRATTTTTTSSAGGGGGRFKTSGRRRRRRRLNKKENSVERPLPLELQFLEELEQPPVDTEVELEVGEDRKLNVEHESEESYYDPNSQEIFNRVVTALKDIKQLVIENNINIENNNYNNDNNNNENQDGIKLRIPINGGFGDTVRFGMLSYPNWKDLQQQKQSPQKHLESCRSYQHLSLDILYHACHKANVICKHLYIYRNPIDILISTVYKRNFHGSHGYLFASRLYITMLEVLESQLANNVENSLGCINFYDDENGNDWKTLIRDVWGWSSSSNYSTSTSTNNDYERIIGKTYKKKEPVSSSTLLFKNSKKNTNNSTTTTTTTAINNNNNDNSNMINELNTFIQNNKPYLDLFYTAHQRTIHAGCMS